MSVPESSPTTKQSLAVLELLVRNHPGVMSQVCGLFSRRAYNVDGIVCLPVAGGGNSRIFLRVDEEGRLDQIVRQIEKLSDVRGVRRFSGAHPLFSEIQPHFDS
ncbi:ACT domain-containing protein [Desulfogranum mediterraneum]|uniref:ACT domain-containing protein n=1 Tax=Desulfogranum mediterraneum TaxID=160661 RepID=UPI00054F0B63|nr:ACT domain-containing protein [Desulfogranum mediterraneum]